MLLLLLLLLLLLRYAGHTPLLHLCMGGSGALRTRNHCFGSRCRLSMWSVQGAMARSGIWLDAPDCLSQCCCCCCCSCCHGRYCHLRELIALLRLVTLRCMCAIAMRV